MTRRFSFLIALPVLTACYVHPAPVDGSRDGGHPSDAPADDAQTVAHDAQPDAHAECATDADCEASRCGTAACVEGECVHAAAAAGTACDDGDLCTESDVCTAGRCIGQLRACLACSGLGGGGAALTTLAARWDKVPEALLPRDDGGVTVTGFADGDLWLAAVRANGSVLFQQAHGHATRGDRGYAIARGLTGGRTLVAGYSQVDGGPERPWLLEVDPAGDAVAPHTPFGERGGSAHGLVPLPDGGMIVLARVDGRATLARLSADLEIEWERSYFDVGWAYGLAGVVVLPDGDLVIAGDVGTFPSRSVHVVRVRPTGDLVWDSPVTADGAHAILARADGKVVVVGQRSGPAGTGAAWLALLDAAGNVVAERTYGVDPNGSIQSVTPAPDGTLVLAATDAGDAWILRTDATGVVLEEALLSLGAYERAETALVLGDGTVIVAGTSDLPGVEGPRHAWVARAASLSALECTD